MKNGVNNGGSTVSNLYVHFPFCRRKCAYCALYSVPGSTPGQRAEHVRLAAVCVCARNLRPRTVYFGGGTPALCDLRPFRGMFPPDAEFTVELHPRDVTDEKLDELKSIGVNRISLGVQSFCDATLASMGRLHSSEEAARAFGRIRAAGFGNSGLDLIVGWPGDGGALDSVRRAIDLGVVHVSVYTLIVEPGTQLSGRIGGGCVAGMPTDDAMLDAIAEIGDLLSSAGIRRYEISNYAKPGFECRHNLAVWHGEDYLGIGPGAHSRVGYRRWRVADGWEAVDEETLDPLDDARERAIFALRLTDGIDFDRAEGLLRPASGNPEERQLQLVKWKNVLNAWRSHLDGLCAPGIVQRISSSRYALTRRGMEVCDSVESDLFAKS